QSKSTGTSISTLAKNHRWYRFEQYPQILAQTLTMYILLVELHLLLERNVTATRHLPDAGDARHHMQPLAIFQRVLRHLIGQRWARTSRTPVTSQYMEQLRHLVNTVATDKPTYARHPWIAFHLENHPVSRLVLLVQGGFGPVGIL